MIRALSLPILLLIAAAWYFSFPWPLSMFADRNVDAVAREIESGVDDWRIDNVWIYSPSRGYWIWYANGHTYANLCTSPYCIGGSEVFQGGPNGARLWIAIGPIVERRQREAVRSLRPAVSPETRDTE